MDGAAPGWVTGSCCLALLAWLGVAGARPTQAPPHTPPPDGEWTANAVLTQPRASPTWASGAVQGVVVRDGKVYAYGDVVSAKPRVGVIREYDLELNATGRVVWLRRDDKPLILHPTGLTWDTRIGTFLGDTVLKKAIIYRLDWARAWHDGNLDHAVLDVIDDDAAINGCRPTLGHASAAGPFWRLLITAMSAPRSVSTTPKPLMAAKRSSAVRRDRPSLSLRPVQPEHAVGRVERAIDLRAKRDRGTGLAARCARPRESHRGGRRVWARRARATYTFMPHDELEGYWPLDEERSLLAVARRSDNLVVGIIRATEPRTSPAVAK